MYLRPEDKVLILEANARYNHAFDTRDVVEWLETWTDYATLNTPDQKIEGKVDMRAWFLAQGSEWQCIRHFTFNIVSDGDIESAVASCDFLVMAFDSDPKIIASGSYLDHLTRIGDAWRFASRKITYDAACRQVVSAL